MSAVRVLVDKSFNWRSSGGYWMSNVITGRLLKGAESLMVSTEGLLMSTIVDACSESLRYYCSELGVSCGYWRLLNELLGAWRWVPGACRWVLSACWVEVRKDTVGISLPEAVCSSCPLGVNTSPVPGSCLSLTFPSLCPFFSSHLHYYFLFFSSFFFLF